MSITHATSVRTGIANYVVDLIDAGTPPGKIKFYTSGFGTLMCTINFQNPAFDLASSPSVSTTTGSISGTITSTGTQVMAAFKIEDSSANEVLRGTVGTAGADINLTDNEFAQNDILTINSLTYTACP